MPIILKKVQRINPSKKDEAKKWYAIQQTLKQLDETEVANRIADETTLNPAEALMAIRQLRKVVQQALTEGQSVKLGDWGSFYASVSSNGFATQKELTANAIRNNGCKLIAVTGNPDSWLGKFCMLRGVARKEK